LYHKTMLDHNACIVFRNSGYLRLGKYFKVINLHFDNLELYLLLVY
jgi:hypothetical protein